MPRRMTRVHPQVRRDGSGLVGRLADEWNSDREYGQPVIYEEPLPGNRLHVTVVWDDWDRLPPEERTEIIVQAYEKVQGPGAGDRIALASGLTVPEAHAAGMLPFAIVTALRSGDAFTWDQCREAVIEEGASILWGTDRPQLRFASREEAEAARRRLADRLNGSDPIWLITQDMGPVEDWSSR